MSEGRWWRCRCWRHNWVQAQKPGNVCCLCCVCCRSSSCQAMWSNPNKAAACRQADRKQRCACGDGGPGPKQQPTWMGPLYLPSPRMAVRSRSKTATSTPFLMRATASTRPPMPAPAISTLSLRCVSLLLSAWAAPLSATRAATRCVCSLLGVHGARPVQDCCCAGNRLAMCCCAWACGADAAAWCLNMPAEAPARAAGTTTDLFPTPCCVPDAACALIVRDRARVSIRGMCGGTSTGELHTPLRAVSGKGNVFFDAPRWHMTPTWLGELNP